MVIPLSNIIPGETARIVAVGNDGPIAGRLRDLGFEVNTVISCVLQKPRKNIAAYLVRSAVIALRECDSRYILVTPYPAETVPCRSEVISSRSEAASPHSEVTSSLSEVTP